MTQFNMTCLNPLETSNLQCENCHKELVLPYIVCAVCSANICPLCFSRGVEFKSHESNHKYSIFNQNITLFKDSQWTAKEELDLLDSLLENQNFTLAKRVLPQYSETEIRDHYNRYYLEKNGHESIPTFLDKFDSSKQVSLNPHYVTLTNMDDPPRYTCNSIGYQTVSGYNPFRGDFEVEFDTAAEETLSSLTCVDQNDSDYELMVNLQCAIVQKYNVRLRERMRRRQIIRNHGLISVRKMSSWLYRYDTTITSKVYEHLIRFAQFYSGEGFEKFMEAFHLAGQLKAKIARYCDYRRRGIKTRHGIQLYLKMKSRHEASIEDVKAFKTRFPLHFNQSLNDGASFIKRRLGFSPLEVEGLPGYEKLTQKEQELCRGARLVPLSYLEFRDILVAENSSNGSVKLQTARKLLKIDVNKTRRLYDFLVQEAFINM